MKILYLIDSLSYNASARQIYLLGPGLANSSAVVEICCLGPASPWSAALQQAGVTVHTLGWTRWFDFSAVWNLREILHHASPDVIHVWGLAALRTLAVVAKELLPRVILSAFLPVKGNLAWWDRRLLKHVRCLAVGSADDRERCLRQGFAQEAVHVVGPAVKENKEPIPSENGPATFLPTILCIAKLEHEDGAREAIWAFDVLHQLFPDALLQLVGLGSQQTALHELTLGLQNAARVQFLGAPADVTNLLRSAGVVWVPSQANCGRQVALEAMALGRAIVASDVPCLREVVRDGENGFLVPVGDVVALARRTRLLLQDESLRERLGATARQYVQRYFAFNEVVERWQVLYRSAAA
jgi:glycosyltransferase involved in cell wall biosynthesis